MSLYYLYLLERLDDQSYLSYALKAPFEQEPNLCWLTSITPLLNIFHM